jgi:hypothetical protein
MESVRRVIVALSPKWLTISAAKDKLQEANIAAKVVTKHSLQVLPEEAIRAKEILQNWRDKWST